MAVKIHCIEKPRLAGSLFRISSEDGKKAERVLQGHWWQAIAQDKEEREFLVIWNTDKSEEEVDWKHYDFVVQFGDNNQDVTRYVELVNNEFYNV
ncbi:MAG: hypothetical protein UDB11_01495 [Peptococcaceae bacterium]|nr:hypothetical protein [Peptococcaceae bacterium]